MSESKTRNKFAVCTAQGQHFNIEADRFTGPDDQGTVYFWIGSENIAMFHRPDSVRKYVSSNEPSTD